ncbi:hypothetical protein TASIC1_0005063600 [Trichoderma asperellum]|uniref:Uncharacterized protein n=1 Tax=Trichoderma asperellum TaxID=101201 RepID=A0A6V8QY11_TRIAP|nr:hypothetical protein TASIC1_0005063600 [Trichoderma asperellum]
MLVYQGQPKANPNGVESVTAILPTKAEAGAPCIVLWRKATTASTNSKSASREPPNFGNFEAILEKDDNKNIKFKSSTSKLELEFTGDHKTVSLSFQPENGGQIQNIKLTLALGDPFKTHSPQSEASIFGGPVIVQNKGRGNLVALVLCEKDEKGSQKPISVLIEWGSEVAMAEIPLRVQTCQSQDKDTIPDHDENLCFSLNSRQHHFHGMSDAKPDTKSGTKSNAKSDEKSDEPAAWQTTQSYPSLGKYSNSMHSIVRRSADARHTRVWNDTAENDKGIAPSLVTVTIQESGAKNTSYNKGHDNFHEDPGKSITKVLYPRDRICRRAVGNDAWEVEDMFTFQFAEPQIINLYRYIKIRGLVPTGTNEGGSGLPSHGLPSAGSFVWFDINGKFLKFYEAKKEGSKGQDAITRFGFGLFDPKKDNEAIHHNFSTWTTIMALQ